MLDTYEYMDDYSGCEEEHVQEIRSMLMDPAGTDATIGSIEEFLQNSDDDVGDRRLQKENLSAEAIGYVCKLLKDRDKISKESKLIQNLIFCRQY